MHNNIHLANKDVDHICPACNNVLATWTSVLNGGFHEIRIHGFYKQSPLNNLKSGQGRNTAENFDVSGKYAAVSIGDRYYITVTGSNVQH